MPATPPTTVKRIDAIEKPDEPQSMGRQPPIVPPTVAHKPITDRIPIASA